MNRPLRTVRRPNDVEPLIMFDPGDWRKRLRSSDTTYGEGYLAKEVGQLVDLKYLPVSRISGV